MIKGEDDHLHEDDNEANGKRRRVQRACDVSEEWDTLLTTGFCSLADELLIMPRFAGRRRFAVMGCSRRKGLAAIGRCITE